MTEYKFKTIPFNKYVIARNFDSDDKKSPADILKEINGLNLEFTNILWDAITFDDYELAQLAYDFCQSCTDDELDIVLIENVINKNTEKNHKGDNKNDYYIISSIGGSRRINRLPLFIF